MVCDSVYKFLNFRPARPGLRDEAGGHFGSLIHVIQMH